MKITRVLVEEFFGTSLYSHEVNYKKIDLISSKGLISSYFFLPVNIKLAHHQIRGRVVRKIERITLLLILPDKKSEIAEFMMPEKHFSLLSSLKGTYILGIKVLNNKYGDKNILNLKIEDITQCSYMEYLYERYLAVDSFIERLSQMKKLFLEKKEPISKNDFLLMRYNEEKKIEDYTNIKYFIIKIYDLLNIEKIIYE